MMPDITYCAQCGEHGGAHAPKCFWNEDFLPVEAKAQGPRVVEFKPKNNDKSVVDRLGECTEFVRDNAVSGIAIVMVLPDGTFRACWSDLPNYTMMIGAVERVKERMVKKCEGEN